MRWGSGLGCVRKQGCEECISLLLYGRIDSDVSKRILSVQNKPQTAETQSWNKIEKCNAMFKFHS